MVAEAELVAPAADCITVGFTAAAIIIPTNNMLVASVNVLRTKFFCSYEFLKKTLYKN